MEVKQESQLANDLINNRIVEFPVLRPTNDIVSRNCDLPSCVLKTGSEAELVVAATCEPIKSDSFVLDRNCHS